VPNIIEKARETRLRELKKRHLEKLARDEREREEELKRWKAI
jgi:hypothetical protein